MRDRLIELLKNDYCPSPMLCDDKCKYINSKDCYTERIADMLLANGVIVPPCKVRDKVYYIPFGNHIIECIVAQIVIEPFAEIGMSFLCYGGVCFDMRDWGKTIFLTREEAERALKGGERDG